MIDKFSMLRRCISRLEKYVFDRVWNEPYTEYRTNTRPRILNRKVEVLSSSGSGSSTTTSYSPAAGVLTGNFEQITLPDGNPYYVYEVELNQFRPIKLNATSWISLADYCNKSLTDIRIYSDSGVFLWRGGIYIRQDDFASSVLVAVDATMLHRCLDTYTYNGTSYVVTKQADPSEIYFTKYVDSDLDKTRTRINDPDNQVVCTKMTNYLVTRMKTYSEMPIPPNATVAYCNGHLIYGSNYKTIIESGQYIEYMIDEDVVADLWFDRSDAKTYAVNGKNRLLVHIPKANNPKNYLITYNTCDVYLVPTSLTESKMASNYSVPIAGVMVHMCDRAENFHQLTHNDFSIDLDLLDAVAAEAGTLGLNYKVRVLVRSHEKKLGLVRDANHCDLLYSSLHDDSMIIKFLLGDSSLSGYGLSFWSAAYLEQNSSYAKILISRCGSRVENTTEGYYRPVTEKYYKPGKTYYHLVNKNDSAVYTAFSVPAGSKILVAGTSYEFVRKITGELEKTVDHPGVTKVTPGNLYGTSSDAVEAVYTAETVPSAATKINLDDGLMERKLYSGLKITPANQCLHCQLASQCTAVATETIAPRANGKTQITSYECPHFASTAIRNYIGIFGYYHTLSLICKKVTTYRVDETTRKRLSGYGELIRTESDGTKIYQELYKNETRIIPVHVPIALFDLKHQEFYALVYVNGDKVDDTLVQITGDSYDKAYGLSEIHFTWTPDMADELLWEADQRRLVIKLDDSVNLSKGDFITVELMVRPTGESAIDVDSTTFTITEYEDDLAAGKVAFEPLGSNLTDAIKGHLKNSELIFLNGKQLVSNIDYMPFESYYVTTGSTVDKSKVKAVVQNVNYLRVEDNLLEIITTTDKVIGNAKGFLIANRIEWDGIAPFWFDNLSILSVGGKVCSNFEYHYSGLDILDATHVNGEPFMVRTSVPEAVLEIMGNSDLATLDIARANVIRAYFEVIEAAKPYRALIPYSHKVYSTYILKILKDFLTANKDFSLYSDATTFKAQFAEYESLKASDVVFAHEVDSSKGLSTSDLKFLDIYPIYHNLQVGNRQLKAKIAYLLKMLMPSDDIRHREHINGQ